MKLGAIHRNPPVNRLIAGARVLAPHDPAAYADWSDGLIFDGSNPLGNDKLSNCVECAFLRLAQVRWHAMTHEDLAPTTDQAAALYARFAGYDPTNPTTDNGSDVLSCLSQWAMNGIQFPGNKPLDCGYWFSADPMDPDQVRSAVDFGVGALFTLQLYAGDEQAEVWGNLPQGAEIIGAHAVCCVGYDDTFFQVVTWGRIQPITSAGLLSRLMAVSVPLSRDFIISPGGKTLAGQEWADVVETIRGSLG